MSPLSNAFLKGSDLDKMEPFYPLLARVCGECFLVQLEKFESPKNIFTDYAYFSSFSSGWLKHAEDYTKKMVRRFALNESSMVMEIASNDGYLLQYVKSLNVPCLGIEPAANVAEAARAKGIHTINVFFGSETADEIVKTHGAADLLIGNNVLAHVPDLNDFVSGLKIALKEEGVITMEFPHLLLLMEGNQFDTIYHEHFSYFSLLTARKIFAHHGLNIFDVDELTTHGGSLRIYACHSECHKYEETERIESLHEKEKKAGLDHIGAYANFHKMAYEAKCNLIEFLINAKREGKSVVGYGAPAKSTTLFNYCGIRSDLIEYTVDKNPHKQGMYIPGVHIPIKSPEKIIETKPDYVVILPWNIKNEIMDQVSYIRDWGGKFVTLVPEVREM